MPKSILVIGYGNSLRSDDCVGLYAVRELRKRMAVPNVRQLDVPQLQVEFAAPLAEVDLAVFIDAASSGNGGEVRYERIKPCEKSGPMSHEIDPATLLGVTKELYGKCPEALLATVAGASFEYGTKLSPEVEASMLEVVKHVEGFILDFLGEKKAAAKSV